jgi:hypothetical protein
MFATVVTMRKFLHTHWGIGAVVVGGVALRLAEYVAPSIVFLPDLRVDHTFARFVLTNAFVVAGTVALFGLGRELDRMSTGIVAAMLFTLSPLAVYYGRFHAQQAAAGAAMVGAVLCAARWLGDAAVADASRARDAVARRVMVVGSVVLGSIALALDPTNLHLLAAIPMVAWLRACRRRWWGVALLIAAIAILAVPLRATLTRMRDLWEPHIPPVGAVALDVVTLALLWDRMTVLLLPVGGFVLFALGVLYVRQRRDAIVPLWVAAATIVSVGVANHHLVHGVAYVSLLAVVCLAAGRGASILLAAGEPGLVRRNLATFAVVALILSTGHGEGYAFARIPVWNTAFVTDRETVPLSWLDRLRAHGAWYFMSSARSLDEIGDRVFADEMQATYGSMTFEQNVLFPIFRAPADTYLPPGRSRLPLLLEAEERPTHLGRIVFDPQADNDYAVRSNREGFIIQGPFLVYPEGEYLIDFRVRAAARPSAVSGPVGHVDVAQRRVVLAQAPVNVEALPTGSDYGHVRLTVVLPRAEVTEFRFFGYGRHTVWLDSIRVRPPGSPAATH